MSSATDRAQLHVTYVTALEQTLVVSLSDGRELSLPLDWYPRLNAGTPAERNHWRLIGRGEGVHWPDLDEDLSLGGFLAGRKSGESSASIRRWLTGRKTNSGKRKVG